MTREPLERKNGAVFRLEAAAPGEATAVWTLRVYRSEGRWYAAARRYRSHRVWIVPLEAVVGEVARLGQRAYMQQRLGGGPA